jgi:hypothetical protein
MFAIVQGGLDVSPGGLREQCLQDMVCSPSICLLLRANALFFLQIKRNTPGYAIGELSTYELVILS